MAETEKERERGRESLRDEMQCSHISNKCHETPIFSQNYLSHFNSEKIDLTVFNC